MTSINQQASLLSNYSCPFFLSPPSLTLPNPHDSGVGDLQELQDGSFITCSLDKTLKVWSRKGQLLFSFSHSTKIYQVEELRDRRLVFGDGEGKVQVLDRQTNKVVFTFSDSHQYGVVSMVRLSNDLIATGSHDKTMKIWNVEDKTCCQTLQSHTDAVDRIAETKDGTLVSGSYDKTVKIWKRTQKKWLLSLITETPQYELECTLVGHNNYVNSVIELESGLIATCSDDTTIRLWNRKTQTCVRNLIGHSHYVCQIEEAEKGIIVSASDDRTIRVWKAESGECVNTFRAPKRVWRVKKMKDGSLLYGAGHDRAVYVSSDTWMSRKTRRQEMSTQTNEEHRQQMSMSTDEMKQREEELMAREKAVALKEDEVKAKELEIQHKTSQMDDTKQTLTTTQKELQAKATAMERREREVEDRKRRLDHKERAINEAQRGVEEREERVAQRERQLEDREKAVKQREEKVEAKEKEVKRREDEVRVKELQHSTPTSSPSSSSETEPKVGMFRLRAIHKATDSFHPQRTIGRGGFGGVYQGVLNNIDVAIKRKEGGSGGGVKKEEEETEFIQEIAVLGTCRHSSIVPLIGFCIDNNERCLIFPLMKGGPLDKRLQQKENRLSWQQRLEIALQTVEGLTYLHQLENAILHRDVKSGNILLDEHDNARLCDAGLAKFALPSGGFTITASVSVSGGRMVGTPGYIDPAFMNSGQYTAKSDVYSFGVVLLELLSGYPAITNGESLVERMQHELQGDIMLKAVDDLYGWPKYAAKEMSQIAFSCVGSSRSRPSMDEIGEKLMTLKNKVAPHHQTRDGTVNKRGKKICLVCFVKDRGECAFLPCHHNATCVDCAIEITSKKGNCRCPLCYTKIDDIQEGEFFETLVNDVNVN
eukprot:TRINITY_DN1060_c0_g1_i24.p1 TRINITY_DN1060_c0_g1~~TRINITY_DN1060_c0_g1_i24.p1  ORF type:complete len:877 (+),score=262.46 TRINITY_DN1060_c0_g1_i24:270-2900(+)